MKTMKLVSFACVLTILLSILAPEVNSQTIGDCSFQGLDLEKCLNKGENPVYFDSCCRVINQAVETGFYCVCSLLASVGPLLRAPLSLQVSNCYISIPPIAQCQALVPVLLHPPVTDPAVPVLLSPVVPMQSPPVSTPTSFLLPLPPPPPQPEIVQFQLNSTTGDSSTTVLGEPLVSNNTTNLTVYKTKCEFSSGSMNYMQSTLFLVVALYSSVI